jgi:hypothetical protein
MIPFLPQFYVIIVNWLYLEIAMLVLNHKHYWQTDKHCNHSQSDVTVGYYVTTVM